MAVLTWPFRASLCLLVQVVPFAYIFWSSCFCLSLPSKMFLLVLSISSSPMGGAIFKEQCTMSSWVRSLALAGKGLSCFCDSGLHVVSGPLFPSTTGPFSVKWELRGAPCLCTPSTPWDPQCSTRVPLPGPQHALPPCYQLSHDKSKRPPTKDFCPREEIGTQMFHSLAPFIFSFSCYPPRMIGMDFPLLDAIWHYPTSEYL